MKSFFSRPETEADELAALWAARLEGSTLSADDRTALDEWLAAAPANRGLLSAYCQFSTDLEQQLPLLEGIRDGAVEPRPAPSIARPRPWLRRPALAGVMLAAAAAIVLAIILLPARTRPLSVASAVAQRQELTLEDGTRVLLNAQTAIVVDLGRDERHVRLAHGEAFFMVSKDRARPFIVETPAGSVRVTGTRFDVRADEPASLAVTVAEGSVQVRPGRTDHDSPSPVALKAGDRLTAGPAGIQVRALSASEIDDSLAWRSGQAVFSGTPLHDALACFARYHGRGISATAAAADLRVGGRFSLDDLDGFFASLEEVLPVRVSRDLSGTVLVDVRPGRTQSSP